METHVCVGLELFFPSRRFRPALDDAAFPSRHRRICARDISRDSRSVSHFFLELFVRNVRRIASFETEEDKKVVKSRLSFSRTDVDGAERCARSLCNVPGLINPTPYARARAHEGGKHYARRVSEPRNENIKETEEPRIGLYRHLTFT